MALRVIAPGDLGGWDPEVDVITVQRLKTRQNGLHRPIPYEVYRNGKYIGRVVSKKTAPSIQYRTSHTYWESFTGTDPENLVELEGSRPKQTWAIRRLL